MAKEDHARDGVGGLAQAGAREVVMDEALRAETSQEAGRDTVLQMEMDHIVVDRAGILEHELDGIAVEARGDRMGLANLSEFILQQVGFVAMKHADAA